MNKFLFYCFIVCCISILFSCQKELSVDLNSSLTASGSLWDSTGVCLPDSVHGTFYDGIVPESDTAYVEIQVNVTQTGSYSISSDLQDGFLFADSGFFSNTGINTIRLKPVGTPIIPTTATFNISFDTSFCTFSVNIQDSTGTGLGGQQDTTGTGETTDSVGNWQFTEGINFSGNFDSTSKDLTGGITNIYLHGHTQTGDTVMVINFISQNPDIAIGTYTTAANALVFGVTDQTSSSLIYQANVSTPGTNISLTISNYSSVTNTITGTFSGNAQNASGSIITINNGSFTAQLE